MIANADGYEAKADGVSDWLLSPALHDRYKANTELSPHFRWHRVIETCQLAGLSHSSCSEPFRPIHVLPAHSFLDKPITPVNKYRPALVIMQRTGGILRWRPEDLSQPWCFNAISPQQRGCILSGRIISFGWHFSWPVWEQKQLMAASQPPAWNIKSQMTSDNMLDVSWARMRYDIRLLSTFISLCFMCTGVI